MKFSKDADAAEEKVVREVLNKGSEVSEGKRIPYRLWERALLSERSVFIGAFSAAFAALIAAFVIRSIIWVPWIVESFGKGDTLVNVSVILTLLGGTVAGFFLFFIVGLPWDGIRGRWEKRTYRGLAYRCEEVQRYATSIVKTTNSKETRNAARRQVRIVETLSSQETALLEQIEKLNTTETATATAQDALSLLKAKREEIVREVVRIEQLLKGVAKVETEKAQQRSAEAVFAAALPQEKALRRLQNDTDTDVLVGRLAEGDAARQLREQSM